MQTAPTSAPLSKMQIIGLLAERHGLTRYLEFCTATTGNFYQKLERARLPSAHRLMYGCPADFDDGLDIDFRSEGLDVDRCLSRMSGNKLRFDIILVDSFHDYAHSYRDLVAAFDLIDEGGFLVVHDCLPPHVNFATPEYKPGRWCGVTYKAYVDFVSERRLDYCTVDTDYGCGIIHKPGRRSRWVKKIRQMMDGTCIDPSPQRRADQRQRKALWQEWRRFGDDFEGVFEFFQANQKELLQLISSDEFLNTL